MTTNDQQDNTNLADHMEIRVAQLGLTWKKVETLTGISGTHIRNMKLHGRTVHPPAQEAFDRALQWEPGSTLACLNGGNPTPIEEGNPGSAGARVKPAVARRPVRRGPRPASSLPVQHDDDLEMLSRWAGRLSREDFWELLEDLARIRRQAEEGDHPNDLSSDEAHADNTSSE